MEKIVKLDRLEYKPKKYCYFIKKFDDGVYVCKAEWNRKGRGR